MRKIVIIILVATYLLSCKESKQTDINTFVNLWKTKHKLNELIWTYKKSLYLTTNWIFVEKKEQTPNKLLLNELHTQTIPNLLLEIDTLTKNLKAQQPQLLRQTKSLTDSIILAQKLVMTKLNKFSDYERVVTFFEVSPMIERGDVIETKMREAIENAEKLKQIIDNELITISFPQRETIEKINISIENTNQLKYMISESVFLTKNWIHVYKKKEEFDKKLLIQYIDNQIPSQFTELNDISHNWNTSEKELLSKVAKISDTLIAEQVEVTKQLSDFLDYEKTMLIFEIHPKVEDKGNITNMGKQVKEKLDSLTAEFEKEQNTFVENF